MHVLVPLLVATVTVAPMSGPCDPNATAATRVLLAQLAQLSSAPALRMAFGQQRANEEGIGWSDLSGAANRSDILTVTGDWPAVFGFNFGSLTRGPNTTAQTPNVLQAAKRAADVGGIIAAHFPTDNPLGCTHTPKYKDCGKDPTGQPMKNLVPGRAANAQWRAWLDQVADVCDALAPTPVLFRPFHEMYLSNWWGSMYCSPDEFIAGWRFTVDYLRDTRQIHNMLFVFAPDQPSVSITSPLGYAERWPGDAYVDIAGMCVSAQAHCNAA